MKSLLTFLLIATAMMPLRAQTEPADDAERTRIAAEREQADTRFVAQEKSCYRKFAVNDCLKAARAQRRERLADLRRQQLSLNDAERRRRSADRVHGLERSAEQREEDSAAERAEAVARRRDKQEGLSQRAAERAQAEASAPARAMKTQGDTRKRPAATHAAKAQPRLDPVEELRRSEQRQQEAKERKERVARRLQDARKPAVPPLPIPP
jgi:colicin import membrane protein